MSKSQRQRRAGALLGVLNGALAGVAGVYLSTHSVLVTALAAAAAVILGIILLLGD
ncbi:MAG TPA: hypothetical protein VGH88_05615 [Streptosporangiaceae bacterium]|jgi:hypothetical protein